MRTLRNVYSDMSSVPSLVLAMCSADLALRRCILTLINPVSNHHIALLAPRTDTTSSSTIFTEECTQDSSVLREIC